MAIYIYRIALVSGLLFLGTLTYAQKDLIVTQAGEEIRCKILDETPSRFVYAYLGPKNKVFRNEIFKNLVTSFKYNYYDTDVLINEKSIKSKPVVSKADPMRPPANEQATDNSKKESSKTTKKETKKEDIPQKDNPESKKTAKTKKEAAKDEVAKNVAKSDSVSENSSTEKVAVATKEIALERKDETVAKIEEVKPPIEIKKEPESKKEVIAKKEAEVDKGTVSPLADQAPVSEFKNYLKYRVGAKGGLGNIVAKNADTSPYGLYKEKLLRGWMFGIDAAYFPKDNIGFGATYTNYQASNKSGALDYTNLFSEETIKNGTLSNKVSHKFVGPTFLYRKNIDFKTFAILTLSPGMHLYSDKGQTNLSNFHFEGKAYGAAATLGLDFLLGNDIFGRDIILSLEGGYNYGQITSLNKNDGKGNVTLSTPINLNRLDFTIGLRFTRFPMYLR